MPAVHSRGLLVAVALVAPGCPQPEPGTSSTSGTSGDPQTASASTDIDEPTSPPDIMGTTDEPGSSTGSSSTGEPLDSDSSTSSSATSDTTGTSSSSTGEPGVCGDGAVDPGEDCDDGNADSGDGCLPDCQFGPGAKISTLTPPTIAGESMSCFTQVRKEFLDDTADALVIGGRLKDFGPNFEWGTHVWQVSLPEATPANWSYAEYADPFDRDIFHAVTAANGDTITAGRIGTDHVDPDTGGYLWLARFKPDGALAWSHETKAFNVAAARLLVTPGGNIVVSGHCNGLCAGSSVNVFDPAGAPLWHDSSPQDMEIATDYGASVVDAAGKIYVVGVRAGADFRHLLLRAYQPGGAPIWTKDHEYPLAPFFNPHQLVLTSDDTLVVGVAQSDAEQTPIAAMGLAAFDTAGDSLWWNEWTASEPGALSPGRMLATDDGGFHMLAGLRIDFMPAGSVVARFDADGEAVWANTTVTTDGARDLLLGADGLLYVLRSTSIEVYVP